MWHGPSKERLRFLNIDTPDIADWAFCGTADGVFKCKCPAVTPVAECIYDAVVVTQDALCDICPIDVGDQFCNEECSATTDCVDGVSVIFPCANGVGTCTASGQLIDCDVCPVGPGARKSSSVSK